MIIKLSACYIFPRNFFHRITFCANIFPTFYWVLWILIVVCNNSIFISNNKIVNSTSSGKRDGKMWINITFEK
jgi:hypothetical protein